MLFTQEIIDKFKNSHEKLSKYYYYNSQTIDKKIIGSLFRTSCGHGIGYGYLEQTKNYITNNDPKYDMIAIFTKETQTKKTVAGFILVQLGECAKMPNAYSISVVCSKLNCGKLLMGLALYAIKKNTYVEDKHCILELAGGYINVIAYCLYSKFGFKKDLSLYGSDCFPNENNLPMIVNLDRVSAKTIIETSVISTPLTDETLCNISRNKQIFLGVALNLQIRINKQTVENAFGYNRLKNNLDKNGIDVADLINMIHTQDIETFEHLFVDSFLIPKYLEFSDSTMSGSNFSFTSRSSSSSSGGTRKRSKTYTY